MKRIILIFSIPALCLLSSCKGRTMENMIPNGDTVEVSIDTADYSQQVVEPINFTDSVNQ